MNLDESIRYALDGVAVLFVGAGFSADAQTAKGLTLPTGGALSDLLAGELSLSSTPPLDRVSDMYKNRKGEHHLLSLMRERLTATTITPEQRAICMPPWRRIYTTNYDNVVKLCHRTLHKDLVPVTLRDEPTNLTPSKNYCLYINGDLEQADINNFDTTITLTNTSYLSDLFNKSRRSRLFREDVEVARAVLFIGYSLGRS
jgi:hypothetical protein